MKITQIRNATIILEYSGLRFLVDPMLGPRGSFPPFPMAKDKRRNPLEELPFSVDRILNNIDAVIITHTHADHLDESALNAIPKDKKIFVQNRKDQELFTRRGFGNVEILKENTVFGNIKMTKTKSRHGKFPLIMIAGHTCGVMFHSKLERPLYLMGDTIWYDGVKETIDTYKPEVIIVNAGGNKFRGFHHVIMNDEDVVKLHKYSPDADIVATHLEGVNHNTVTRKMLRDISMEFGFSDKLFIPDNGETIQFINFKPKSDSYV